MSGTCVFFGHRDASSALTVRLDQAIRRAVLDYGITRFQYGGNGTFDRMAAQAVVRAQSAFPHIRLELVHAYLPGKADQHALPCDSSVYPEGLEYVPQRFAISHRNRWMIQHCDLVICFVERSYGGASQACRLAQRRGVPVINLAEER